MMNLYMSRAFDGGADIMSLYMSGPTFTSGDLGLYLLGGYPTPTGYTSLHMAGSDNIVEYKPFYIRGF
jgi:hypothetical protein